MVDLMFERTGFAIERDRGAGCIAYKFQRISHLLNGRTIIVP